jgi:hypothetical protein
MGIAPLRGFYTLYCTPESRGMSVGDVSKIAVLTLEEGGRQKLSECESPSGVPRSKARGQRIEKMTNSSLPSSACAHAAVASKKRDAFGHDGHAQAID